MVGNFFQLCHARIGLYIVISFGAVEWRCTIFVVWGAYSPDLDAETLVASLFREEVGYHYVVLGPL